MTTVGTGPPARSCWTRRPGSPSATEAGIARQPAGPCGLHPRRDGAHKAVRGTRPARQRVSRGRHAVRALPHLRDNTTGELWGGSRVLKNLNNLEWRLRHLPPPPVSILATKLPAPCSYLVTRCWLGANGRTWCHPRWWRQVVAVGQPVTEAS